MVKLKVYCNIFSGYSFRHSLQMNENHEIRVINLKDVNPVNNEINYSNLYTTDDFPGSSRHILQDGDILVTARGNDNGAVLFQKHDSALPVIAAGAIIVIRPMIEYLIPAYLAWYLNIKDSQLFFKRSQVGTTVRNLSIGTLLDFEIKVPTLQKQLIIGELYILHQQSKSIARQREEKWSQLINEQIKGIL